MAGDDDPLARSLPQAPLPAPARREAAIGEALRRFDGAEAVSPRPARQRGGGWLSITSRPQLGTVIAASVVAVIGLPIAWMIVREETRPLTEQASPRTAELPTFDGADKGAADLGPAASVPAPADAEAAGTVPTADSAEPRAEEPAAERSVPPVPGVAEGEPERRQAPAAEEAKRLDDGYARGMAATADALVVSGARRAAPALPAAPPSPPPAAMQESSARSDHRSGADELFVTGRAKLGKSVPDRGDWNACTINDPRRSLAACRHLVDPAAKGPNGQAAAHLADGLSLAWQGRLDPAIVAFDRAIEIAPKSSLAYLNRGLAFQRRGDEARALADLDRAVRLSPGEARGYYSRSQLLRARGEKTRAAADERRAVDLDADYEALVEGARD